MTAPALTNSAQPLSDWLARAAIRARWRDRLHQLGWMLCAIFGASVLYLLLAVLRIPDVVRVALYPLLLLSACAALAWFAWRATHTPPLDAIAHQADVRGQLKDELRSALWFARQPARSSWETLVLQRAARTVEAIDPRTLFPLRFTKSLRAATALGVIALLLALAREARDASALILPSAHGPSNSAHGSSRASDAVSLERGPGARAAVTSKAQRATDQWNAPAQLDGLANEAQAQRRDTHPLPARAAPDSTASASEQSGAMRSAGRELLARAAEVSADVAHGIVARLEALFGGSDTTPAAAPQTAQPGDTNASTERGKTGDALHRASEPEVTMDVLNEALRALSQAPSGEHPLPSSSGEGSQNKVQGNIAGGAMGVRVNTTEAGPGGQDAPPNAPDVRPREPTLGQPTARLAARMQRLTASTTGNDTASADDGFYVATQAQAARLNFSAAPQARRGAGETAIAREQVPLAYRASVRRYFLVEHGKEP